MGNKRVIAVVAVVAVIVAAGAAVWFLRDDDGGVASPVSSDPVPTVPERPAGPDGTPAVTDEDAAATAEFLDGAGAPLLTLHGVAATGIADTVDGCDRQATQLEADLSMAQAAELASQVADPVLRTAFHSQRRAVGVALTGCLAGTPDPAAVDDVDELAGITQARLDEIEANR